MVVVAATTAAAAVAIAGQAVLGVPLISVEDREAPQFHMFYGFVALAAVGIIYSYRQQLEAHRYLLYGLGGWFLMGLATRAMVIGPTRCPPAAARRPTSGAARIGPPVTGQATLRRFSSSMMRGSWRSRLRRRM